MTKKPPFSSVLNELMSECFRLNRSYLDVSQQLTEGAGVTGTQWGVLAALGQGGEPTTVAATARRMGLARQSVQRITDVLADTGLVNYLPNPEDKRAKLVEVTAAGRALLADMKARQHAWVDSIVGDYSDTDIDAAIQLIKNIRQRISQ
jgi:DNA-binding MarR family transcriptional regulator